MNSDKLLKIFKIKPASSLNKAVCTVREYLDNQPNPLRTCNDILTQLGIPFEKNHKKAYVFVMTAVEHAMQDNLNIERIIQRSNERVVNITNMMGIGSFYVEQTEEEQGVFKSKGGSKGSKSQKVMEIYMEYRDQLDEKAIIAKIEEELEITKQNAYTYIYNLKKKLKS